MACNAPLAGWKRREATALGKRAVTFRLSDGYSDLPVNLPCGKCAGCRMDKARGWAVRCSHEASLYDYNCFVTLTYDDEHLPVVRGVATLQPEDFVNFMKRLRKCKSEDPDQDGPVRFFQAGEYGKLGRPHHHVLLFNCAWEDQKLWRTSAKYRVLRSEKLEKLWSKGFVEFGSVTFESAGYVAKYTLKKDSVVLAGRVAEYLTMSRRPGIGARWIKKFFSDVYPSDELILEGGRVCRPPRFYDDQADLVDVELMKRVRLKRQDELTDEMKSGVRNFARETILRKKVSDSFRRNL